MQGFLERCWLGTMASESITGYYPQLLDDPKWKELKAVKEGKVYEIPCVPFNWFDRPPSVNRIIGLKWLGYTLYPDIYDYDLIQEVKEFYSLFYHFDLSDEEANDLLKNAVPELKTDIASVLNWGLRALFF